MEERKYYSIKVTGGTFAHNVHIVPCLHHRTLLEITVLIFTLILVYFCFLSCCFWFFRFWSQSTRAQGCKTLLRSRSVWRLSAGVWDSCVSSVVFVHLLVIGDPVDTHTHTHPVESQTCLMTHSHTDSQKRQKTRDTKTSMHTHPFICKALVPLTSHHCNPWTSHTIITVRSWQCEKLQSSLLWAEGMCVNITVSMTRLHTFRSKNDLQKNDAQKLK